MATGWARPWPWHRGSATTNWSPGPLYAFESEPGNMHCWAFWKHRSPWWTWCVLYTKPPWSQIEGQKSKMRLHKSYPDENEMQQAEQNISQNKGNHRLCRGSISPYTFRWR